MGDKDKKQEPSATQAEPRSRTAGADRASDPPGLDQLREILFGATLRELDRRLARVDAHLGARAGDVEQEGRRRVEALEAHLRKETDALAMRVDRELAETSDTIRALAREHHDRLGHLEERVARLEEALARSQRELRQELLDQTKSFLDELNRARRELLAELARELGDYEEAPPHEGTPHPAP